MKTPWHLWVIGALTLAWHGFGAFDYTMTQSGNEAYLAQFSPEQRSYFTSYPAWAVAGWALGVWGAVIGSALILLRSRFAVAAFWISLVGLIVTGLWSFWLAETSMAALMGPEAFVVTALIYVVLIGALIYARRMTRAGVLR
jgi:hypothetical protein